MKAKTFNGIEMTEPRRETLVALASLGCGKSTTAIHGVFPGGLLATLVAMGLAERCPPDAIGGCRYRANAAGIAEAGFEAEEEAV